MNNFNVREGGSYYLRHAPRCAAAREAFVRKVRVLKLAPCQPKAILVEYEDGKRNTAALADVIREAD